MCAGDRISSVLLVLLVLLHCIGPATVPCSRLTRRRDGHSRALAITTELGTPVTPDRLEGCLSALLYLSGVPRCCARPNR